MKETWPIEKLHGWEKNPRAIRPEDFNRLKRQIQKHDQFKPVIITPNGEVIGGNMRLKAYKELGITDIWVSVVDPKTEAEKIGLALADNDRAGYYLEDELDDIIANTPDLELGDYHVEFGDTISLADFAQRNEEVEEDEFDVEENLPDEPVSKLGDIYQLGRHRLMCGDSTQIGDVSELMNGNLSDLVFTDPPYGVSYADKNAALNAIGRGNLIQTPIENDHKSVEEMYSIWLEVFKNMITASKDGFSYYVCSPQGGELMMMMMMALKESGVQVKHTIIWVKNNIVIGRADYHYKHEPILYGWGKGSHTFYGGRDQSSVWDFNKPMKSDLHPTMKPIELVAKAVSNSSKSGDIILDLFGGSGSTLIACEQLDRTCYMMELDPRYIDVIIKRWEQFTGQKAQKVQL